ncbi:outer membrane beta-barrel protein [Nevskia soli]|uniref:outer membrane beta-barrel protein n=1 Tax=Nevskia soli TaxID=418856 RepID=UPI0014706464|nr:outer membrane beta-barrel protein [Nevskia soli]
MKSLLSKVRWLSASVLLLSSSSAFAWPFYVAPGAYYSTSDSGRKAGNDYGVQFAAGYSLTDNFSFEALSESSQYRLDDAPGKIKAYGLSLQTVYTPWPNQALSPIILGGAGWLHTDTPKSNFDSAVARGGLGLHWQIPESNFGVRTDAVVRHDFDSKAYNDLIFSLGLTYRIGNPTYHDPRLVTSAVPAATDIVLEPFIGEGQRTAAILVPSNKSAPVEATFHGVVSKGLASLNDNDGDGIDDSHDKCPDTPPNAVVDSDGCIIYIKK